MRLRRSGCAKSYATSPRVRCAAPGSGWTNCQRTGALPVRVAIERVRLYTLTGEAGRALEVGATALDSSTGEDHAELCLLLARAAIVARRWSEADDYVVRAGRPDDARSSVLLAEAAHGAGRIDAAIDHANRAVERSAAGPTS